MAVTGRVMFIQNFTPVSSNTESNIVKEVASTYYPVTMYFDHHRMTSRLFYGEYGKIVIGNVMECDEGIRKPSIQEIEIYRDCDGRILTDASGMIDIVTIMVQGNMIMNKWIREHHFYDLSFLIHNDKTDIDKIVSPDKFEENLSFDNHRIMAFGLRHVNK